MELIRGVHLVGSGRLGFSMTDPYDSHVYLVESAGDAALIDAGCGRDPDAIVAGIEAAGVEPRRVSRILLTHSHADHSGGAGRLSVWLEAEVWAPAVSADAIAAGDEDAIGLTAARLAGVYPPDYRFHASPVHRRLAGGSVDIGEIAMTVLPTPGHAADHLAYVATIGGQRVVFSGDLIFARGRIVILGTQDCDLQAYAASVQAMGELAPDVLLPGHAEVVLGGAAGDIARAAEQFARQSIPPGLE